MFAGQVVGGGNHLVNRVAHDDFAAFVPGLARNACGGQDVQLALHLGHGFPRQLFAGRQQHGG